MAKNKLSYIDVHIDAKTPKGIRVKKTIQFVNASFSLFLNSQHYLVELSTGAISFYYYICEHMDRKNEITLDIDFKIGYINFISKVTSKKEFYSARSLDRHLNKLKELGFIIPIATRRSAFYLVNPKYVFRGSETARKKLLQSLIEKRIANGESLKGLVDEEDSTFLS